MGYVLSSSCSTIIFILTTDKYLLQVGQTARADAQSSQSHVYDHSKLIKQEASKISI
jgi:hypothetical protein